MSKKSVRDQLRADPDPEARVNLIDIDAADTHGLKEKKALKKLAGQHAELFKLQDRLWAERKRSLLIVMQGMDTSGKDGTVKHVMTGLNPAGVLVNNFKAPTPVEKRHQFLWRFKDVLPGPGLIGIFNRSHYEDVLVAKVKKLATEDTIERRYGEINAFEAALSKAGTTIVKLCLHISYDEQRQRLEDRLADPDKHWKFSSNDINERAYWDDYQSAYDAALTRCSTKVAPWYIIPANNKWYRDWAVAQILIETLTDMNPQYPRVKLDVKGLMKRLAAPKPPPAR
ncbi:MAG: hypothetical protein NVS9B1_26140 [Candidatus Dormibacteraceae bacterium]